MTKEEILSQLNELLERNEEGTEAHKIIANTIKYLDEKKARRNNIVAIKELFSYWNELKIIKHKILSDEIKGRINAKLTAGYSIDNIKAAMKNYAMVLKNNECYMNYRWKLDEFMLRGFEKFEPDNFNINAFKRIDTKRMIATNYKPPEPSANRPEYQTYKPDIKQLERYKEKYDTTAKH